MDIVNVKKQLSLVTKTMVCGLFAFQLSACGGGGGSNSSSTTNSTVSTNSGPGGSISPASEVVSLNASTVFTLSPDTGFAIDSVSGCNGSLSGTAYTTGAITADCTVSATFVAPPVAATSPALSFVSVKTFRLNWTDASDATYYRVMENPDGNSGFTQVGQDIPQGSESFDHLVPLYARINAQYLLQSCNAAGCIDSITVSVSDNLTEAIGYVKSSNSDAEDLFGRAGGVSLSGDGSTLAVGARGESSNAIDINNDETDNSLGNAGAVYVFVRDDSGWAQQAYIKAPISTANDYFGTALSLSENGNTLAVSAHREDSDEFGIVGGLTNNSGAVYVFTRNANDWSQQSFLKVSNIGAGDRFGATLKLSGDGNTLVAAATFEDSNATGVDGDEGDNSLSNSGAAYVFIRDNNNWQQQAYIKASNPGANDRFGGALALSTDGNTLAVGVRLEDSNATTINGDEDDNSAENAGAVYIYTRSGVDWSPQAYIKADNLDADDRFGVAVSLNGDGNILAVGSYLEDSNSTSINMGGDDDSFSEAGAVYVFTRSNQEWQQQAYIKSNNNNLEDRFGGAVSLNNTGDLLAVGAIHENGNGTGINSDGTDNSVDQSGAVYVYAFSAGSWNHLAYVKASIPGTDDNFGSAVSLSGDGETLAVGAAGEASNTIGINGDASDDSNPEAGAVYLF